MCESIHDEKHKSILEEICVGLRKELDSYVETVAKNKEKEEAFTPKKATRDYTDLVTKSYENGCLSEIAAAICPCNKLYFQCHLFIVDTISWDMRLHLFFQIIIMIIVNGFVHILENRSLLIT